MDEHRRRSRIEESAGVLRRLKQTDPMVRHLERARTAALAAARHALHALDALRAPDCDMDEVQHLASASKFRAYAAAQAAVIAERYGTEPSPSAPAPNSATPD